MDYLEFIARVTSHIPDKGQVMVRYYGLYSNAHRGKIRKAGVSPFHPPIIEGQYHVPSRGWAEMIRKVYEVDPLIYPSCRGQKPRVLQLKVRRRSSPQSGLRIRAKPHIGLPQSRYFSTTSLITGRK